MLFNVLIYKTCIALFSLPLDSIGQFNVVVVVVLSRYCFYLFSRKILLAVITIAITIIIIIIITSLIIRLVVEAEM